MRTGSGLFLRRPVLWAAVALCAGAALVLWNSGFGHSPVASAQEKTAARGQAIAVEVATAQTAHSREDIRAIGSLRSDEAVEIAPEISGRVQDIVFEEGQPVKKGDELVRLDDALVRAEVTDAEARLKFAEANDERARVLSRTGNVTERSRDEASANLETARAAVELAKARLDKHTLRAPFDGVAGVRAVSVGAFINAGARIANIEKIDRLKVDFKVPETYLKDIRIGQTIEVEADALPNRTFEAVIYAINPLVDVNGRALDVRARLDNPGLALRPGLFARILIRGVSERAAIFVPEGAVLPRAGDAFVFRIVDGKAFETRVRLGQRRNAEVEVLGGLKDGDVIVVAGQHKLRDGVSIEIAATHTATVPPAAPRDTPDQTTVPPGGSG